MNRTVPNRCRGSVERLAGTSPQSARDRDDVPQESRRPGRNCALAAAPGLDGRPPARAGVVPVVQAGAEKGGHGVRIWTIGHSTRPVAELLELLRASGIEVLMDIRRYPGSRRQPQYGREALASALAEAGIRYVHEPGLGGRRAPAADSPNTHWRDAGFRGYADYMATPEFAAALGRLLALASERRVAILCAEAVPWRCHRQLVADALVAAGNDVAHIMGAGRTQPHELNPAARRRPGGTLVYPAQPEQAGLFEGGDDARGD